MSGKVINYYAGGNTAKGFYDLFESNMQELENIYLLKGGPGTGKSTMIKKLADAWLQQGYNIERIHCSSDNDSLDGLIIPALQFGIFDATAPHVLEPKAPGAIEQYVNLGAAWDKTKLKENKEEIAELQTKISEAFQSAYDCFAEGLRIHDYLEDIYINEMDFNKANQVTDELIQKILLNKTSDQGNAVVKHRFFGASTPEGVVDFIPSITEELTKRYFIKGRAGSGKSTLLKKVASAGEDKGFDIEMYHCGFDPESIDMVVIRELGVCVFDSTDPHEYFPERHGDEIVDLYEQTITPGTDEKYESDITHYTKSYKQRMKDGITYLQEAKSLHDNLEKTYIDAVDFAVIDEMYSSIYKEIEELAGESS
ncbi:PRK06851 family protein [Gracilibacillus sp. YIM 98692]|uniref:PRK06851 family protein n=1 Tax=Gracilibacillus sp. YIM 98692 TaxID=2663532 RepID=UPI0013D77A0F|nr:PRK06851 family protein [Gracilibacillus sp. YIM 98692]